MLNLNQFYINGAWTAPQGELKTMPIVNPANEVEVGQLALGSQPDVEKAIEAAAKAFALFSALPLKDRLENLRKIIEVYQNRFEDLADAVMTEMGAPKEVLAKTAQVPLGLLHMQTALELAEKFEWEQSLGTTKIVREPIGVCAMITPWNWPLNQIMCKVAPALVTGCTMILKPSELAPISATILAEIIDEAGLPAGVFNLIHGEGATIGPIMSSHPKVDMVSLTGSQRAGSSVSTHAAETVKRVSLELGGKSANIILEDCDLEAAVAGGVAGMMLNTGQSCNAPSRMFVHRSQLEQAEQIAAAAAEQQVLGDPADPSTTMGPIANKRQFDRVQALVEKGIAEGAKLVAGGPGRVDDQSSGFFAKPTIFSDATNDMTIAREEIFGPVLTIIPYDDEEEAVAMANDTNYGLSGYVSGSNQDAAISVAGKLRTGMVHVNGAPFDIAAPFGGYKQSGVGREWGAAGFEEFLETKAIMGAA